MVRFGASPVTVQRALAELVRQGVLLTRPGDGTFVAPSVARRPTRDLAWQSLALGPSLADDEALARFFRVPPAGSISLGSGYANEVLQPIALLAKAARAAAHKNASWSRLPVEGLEELRHWFARDVGGGTTADQVLLVAGGQSGLSTLLRALIPFGGPLVMESPTYFGAVSVARAYGLRAVPVPVDDEGMNPDLLGAALASTGARVIYLQPAFSNPTGVTLSPERRARILQLARQSGAFVIEDDYARDLGADAKAPPPLFREGDGHVIYLRSLTKCTAPGIRVGAVIAEGPALRRLKAAFATDHWFLSGLLQETALELVTARGWPTFLDRLRATLKARRETAAEALARHFPEARVTPPAGGFSLWVELPAGLEEEAFVEAAALAGVFVNSGRLWFPAEPTGNYVRISIAGAPDDRIEEGVATLGRVARKLLRGR